MKVQKIKETFSGVNTVLSSFNNEELNKIPLEGSWTAGQVAEHMIKSLTGASALLHGPTQPTKRDPQDESIQTFHRLESGKFSSQAGKR